MAAAEILNLQLHLQVSVIFSGGSWDILVADIKYTLSYSRYKQLNMSSNAQKIRPSCLKWIITMKALPPPPNIHLLLVTRQEKQKAFELKVDKNIFCCPKGHKFSSDFTETQSFTGASVLKWRHATRLTPTKWQHIIITFGTFMPGFYLFIFFLLSRCWHLMSQNRRWFR